MTLESEATSRLRGAFPSAIAADVDAALAVIPNSRLTPSNGDIGPVRVAGEALHIPMRLYSPEPHADALDSLGATARTVLACLYTRHNDGHVRERHLRDVISSTADWAPPFVVQLLGEYVIEVHRPVRTCSAVVTWDGMPELLTACSKRCRCGSIRRARRQSWSRPTTRRSPGVTKPEQS